MFIVGRVAVMGQVFRDGGPWSWRKDLAVWDAEVREYMLPKQAPYADCVVPVWEGARLPLSGCWLAKDYEHFMQLRMFAVAE